MKASWKSLLAEKRISSLQCASNEEEEEEEALFPTDFVALATLPPFAAASVASLGTFAFVVVVVVAVAVVVAVVSASPLLPSPHFSLPSSLHLLLHFLRWSVGPTPWSIGRSFVRDADIDGTWLDNSLVVCTGNLTLSISQPAIVLVPTRIPFAGRAVCCASPLILSSRR